MHFLLTTYDAGKGSRTESPLADGSSAEAYLCVEGDKETHADDAAGDGCIYM